MARIYSKKEYILFVREMRRVQREEEKYLAYRPKKDDPNKRSLKDRIPEKTYNLLEGAFEKGFRLLFDKGGGIIEKTGSIDKARMRFEEFDASLERMVHPDTLRAIDKNASSNVRSGKFVGTADGTVLGIFGMGMPDIPIFLGLLLKQCYEIAASYGYDYRNLDERKYTISVLKLAFSPDEDKEEASRECDDLAGIMERGEYFDPELSDQDIKDIAGVLATEMLVAKFIQGLTFFGVVGGAFNYRLMGKVSKAARLKYKKRFLYGRMLRCEGYHEAAARSQELPEGTEE